LFLEVSISRKLWLLRGVSTEVDTLFDRSFACTIFFKAIILLRAASLDCRLWLEAPKDPDAGLLPSKAGL
jgi:hypothetical protein